MDKPEKAPGGNPGPPRVTVVTVARNARGTLGATIDSVKQQTYPYLRHLIVDGASTDGTVDLLRSLPPGTTEWISEPDQGIYDAMNKALDRVTSGYILFLNADDTFHFPGSLSRMMDRLRPRTPDREIHYGSVRLVKSDGTEPEEWTRKHINPVSLFRGPPPHPATLAHRAVYDRVGRFDTRFSLAADYEWFLRAFYRHTCQFQRVDALVTDFHYGGHSTSPRHADTLERENQEIRRIYFSPLQRALYPGLLKKRHILRRVGWFQHTS